MEQTIRIRAATQTDAGEIARIYATSFPHLFRFAFGAGPTEAAILLESFYKDRILGLDTMHVAESEERVLAFVSLRVGLPRKSPGVGSFWSALRRRKGRARALRAAAGSISLSMLFAGRAPRADMAYVDTLAVDEPARRRGLGSLLLEHCEMVAGASGASSVALHVLRSNSAAIALYSGRGYRALPDERALPRLLDLLSRKRGTQLMVKQLT